MPARQGGHQLAGSPAEQGWRGRPEPLGQFLLPWTWDVTQWLMNVLNSAVRRAILIGVSMGAIALSLKIILGIERSYLGGGKDQ